LLKNLQFSSKSKEENNFEREKTFSFEVRLGQGWVPNICLQWRWITRTVHFEQTLKEKGKRSVTV